MAPEAVVFHTTSRKDEANTTAFYPIVVTKSGNKLKFDSHMIFFGLAEVRAGQRGRVLRYPGRGGCCHRAMGGHAV